MIFMWETWTGLRGTPGWTRSQYITKSIGTGSGSYQAGLQYPSDAKELDLGADFIGDLKALAGLQHPPVCAVVGGGLSQAGPQNSWTPVVSQCWEEAGLGQAVPPAGTCKGQD